MITQTDTAIAKLTSDLKQAEDEHCNILECTMDSEEPMLDTDVDELEVLEAKIELIKFNLNQFKADTIYHC